MLRSTPDHTNRARKCAFSTSTRYKAADIAVGALLSLTLGDSILATYLGNERVIILITPTNSAVTWGRMIWLVLLHRTRFPYIPDSSYRILHIWGDVANRRSRETGYNRTCDLWIQLVIDEHQHKD